jgi:uncharacterized protein YbjT (DUF2867 family)
MERRERTARILGGSGLGGHAVARRLVERDWTPRSHILSVGIAILAPEGERLYRGSLVVVPGERIKR